LKGGDGVPPYDIPSNMKLQHFALKNILSRNPAIKIIVGCSKREHVLEAIAAADDDSD
jgi:aryl-alcohol dehydrogenase-like predicted oxidoreductase